jgi:antitoxin (DNA-binding transcriptional repressor) of toxin-antitoxin stability system
LKTRLGGYLRRVRQGMTLVVTDRGEPVAQLGPLPAPGSRDEVALAALETAGVVSREREASLAPFRPVRSLGASATAAVIEGREDRF